MLNIPSEGDLDFTDADTYGDTILHKACRSGSVVVTRYIVEPARIDPPFYKLNLYQDDIAIYDDTHMCVHCNKRHRQMHQPSHMSMRIYHYETESEYTRHDRQIQLCFGKSNTYIWRHTATHCMSLWLFEHHKVPYG